jgi:hypothetical protein
MTMVKATPSGGSIAKFCWNVEKDCPFGQKYSCGATVIPKEAAEGFVKGKHTSPAVREGVP